MLRGFGGTPALPAGTLNGGLPPIPAGTLDAGRPSGVGQTMRLRGVAPGVVSGQGDVTALARGSSQPDGSPVQGANVPQKAFGAVLETDTGARGVFPRDLEQSTRFHGVLEREVNHRLALAEYQRKPEKPQVTHKSGRGT